MWVVWTLDALFRQDFGSALTFKGGTSLSKVFGVIDRFSENVDLTCDIRSLLPEFAGEPGDPIPGSRSAADKITSRARSALRTWVAAEAGPALESALSNEGFEDATAEVERTFWEKATAAHVFCLQQNLRGERFSRHWYDLARLQQHGVADRALADRDLAEDYERMSGSGLLPAGAPSFDEVMAVCAEIEARANT